MAAPRLARREAWPPRAFTLLGLVEHATRTELGLPPTVADSFVLADDDAIAGVRAAYREACGVAPGGPGCRWTTS